jgi:phasin family protein
MYSIPDPVVSLNKGAVQSWLDYATLTAESAEKLLDFQFQSSRAALADALDAARTLSGAKSPQEWVQSATEVAQPAGDRSMAYARHLQALVSTMQSEYTKFFDSKMTDFNKQLSGAIEQVSKNAPAGSDFAVAAFKSALSAANQAYDVAAKAGKHLTEITETTIAPAPTGRKKAA